jgi:two-component system phosphate regulon sensor histidine kinase PhoR
MENTLMEEHYTVLVVDDEKVIRDGCVLSLQPEGYRVLTAENGQQALDLLAKEPVNVVLCDLKMPVMGALEVLQEMGLKYPDIPVIIITGHGTVDDAVECMKRGAYDFITKPFRLDHLILCVRRALTKQRLERQARELEAERARNLYSLAMEQSRMHTIVHCMADGVLVTNRDLEVVLVNAALYQLLGLGALSPPAPLTDFLQDEALREAIQSLLENNDEDRTISLELMSGRTHLKALSAAFRGLDQQVLGTVTVFNDVTSFKELDEMKNDFVRMVSHELRSPISAIRMQHAVILDGLAGELTDKQRELITRAQAKLQGLLELINDMLDVAKMEAGFRHFEQVPLQLPEILGEIVEFMEAKATAQRVKLRLMAAPGLPAVMADHRGMEEVFTNLISNAINYSPSGGDVTISANMRGELLEVRISDQGVGIEPEEVPKIFDKFYRVKSPSTRQIIGTGLGLPIVKSVVEAHRGVIEVESQVGVGSTFRVLLPIHS